MSHSIKSVSFILASIPHCQLHPDSGYFKYTSRLHQIFRFFLFSIRSTLHNSSKLCANPETRVGERISQYICISIYWFFVIFIKNYLISKNLQFSCTQFLLSFFFSFIIFYYNKNDHQFNIWMHISIRKKIVSLLSFRVKYISVYLVRILVGRSNDNFGIRINFVLRGNSVVFSLQLLIVHSNAYPFFSVYSIHLFGEFRYVW